MELAQEIEPNADGTVWTVRLRDGVLLHDGKPFTAEDVVFSFAQILDPKSKSTAGSFFPGLKPQGVKAVDPTTVKFTFDGPLASLQTRFARTAVKMTRKGNTDWTKPVGSGAFTLAEFKPGERTVFERFDEYWLEGKPLVDAVEIYTLNEATQRINALRAGQVDVIAGVDPPQSRVLEGEGFKELSGPGASWYPIVMQKNQAPFDDVRVRQAFRLMIDRQQFVDNVYEGKGKLGNDLFSPFDPHYASDLPQREQDLEQAKSLLKQAGQEGLRVRLPVADYNPQIVPMGTLLAASAKEIGVTVELQRANAATYFDDIWNKRPMFCSEWSGITLLEQMLYCIGNKASSEETGETSAKISALVQEASRTIDDDKRGEILHELQVHLHDEGGYIIPGFSDYLDAHSDKVQGLVTSPYGNLGMFEFREASLAS
jgi:peptide/nickel transport system substrate-binding protein